MIANLLPREDENTVGGTVTVNGIESTDKGVIWTNIVSCVDRITTHSTKFTAEYS